jgi:hypothetical protein
LTAINNGPVSVNGIVNATGIEIVVGTETLIEIDSEKGHWPVDGTEVEIVTDLVTGTGEDATRETVGAIQLVTETIRRKKRMNRHQRTRK